MDSVPGREWISQDIYYGNDTKPDDLNEKLQTVAQKFIDETWKDFIKSYKFTKHNNTHKPNNMILQQVTIEAMITA